MAFPVDAGRQPSSVGAVNTSHTVTLTGSIAAGNLLIIGFSYAITANTVTWPGGWTAIPSGANEQTSGSSEGLASAYRWADGTEGASISVGTSVGTRSASICWRITGAMNPATQAPEALTAIGVNGQADPPSLTPTGGAKDYLWLAIGANSSLTELTTAPTNYSNFDHAQALAGTGAATSAIGGATRQLNAASENPGAFAGAEATSEWVGLTIAIHPAGAAAPAKIHRLETLGVG